jgi:hypothetical protein
MFGSWRLCQGFASPDRIALDIRRRRRDATAVNVREPAVLTQDRDSIGRPAKAWAFEKLAQRRQLIRLSVSTSCRRTSSCRGSLRTRLPGRCLVSASPEVHSLCSGLFRLAYDLDDTSASINNMEVQTHGKQDTG